MNERDPLEIFVDDDKIILKKYYPADIFTGEDMDDLIDYKGKKEAMKLVAKDRGVGKREIYQQFLEEE